MWEWLKEKGLEVILAIVKKQAAKLAISLLLKLDPSQWADALRPHVRAAFEAAGPDWQMAAKTAWAKIAEFMDELLNNSEVGT